MNPGDGQRRRDANNALLTVRAAYRPDPNPEPYLGLWALGGALVIVACLVFAHLALPSLNLIVELPGTPWDVTWVF